MVYDCRDLRGLTSWSTDIRQLLLCLSKLGWTASRYLCAPNLPVAVRAALQSKLAVPGLISGLSLTTKHLPQIPFIVCIVFLGLTFFISSLTWYLTKESESETRRVARLRREAGIKDNAITDRKSVV